MTPRRSEKAPLAFVARAPRPPGPRLLPRVRAREQLALCLCPILTCALAFRERAPAARLPSERPSDLGRLPCLLDACLRRLSALGARAHASVVRAGRSREPCRGRRCEDRALFKTLSHLGVLNMAEQPPRMLRCLSSDAASCPVPYGSEISASGTSPGCRIIGAPLTTLSRRAVSMQLPAWSGAPWRVTRAIGAADLCALRHKSIVRACEMKYTNGWRRARWMGVRDNPGQRPLARKGPFPSGASVQIWQYRDITIISNKLKVRIHFYIRQTRKLNASDARGVPRTPRTRGSRCCAERRVARLRVEWRGGDC